MNLNLRGKRVAVERFKKQSKSPHGGIILPESEAFSGLIKYTSPDADPKLKVGDKVYFTTNHQAFNIKGVDLCIMDDVEIVAVVQE